MSGTGMNLPRHLGDLPVRDGARAAHLWQSLVDAR